MKLEGSLQEIGLVGLLRNTAALRKTGILTIQSESDIIAVTFLDGRIVAADALNQPMEEGLGQVLAERQLVDSDTFTEVVGDAKATGQRVVGLLLERGVVEREQLLQAVRLQTYRLLLQLLRWREGEYNLFVGDEISYDEGIEPLSVEELLIRAQAELGARGPLEGTVHELGTMFDRRSDSRKIRILGRDGDEPTADPGEVWLSLEEALVLDRLEGSRAGTTLLTETGLDEYRLRFALHRLHTLGLVSPGQTLDPEDVANTGLRRRPPVRSPSAAPPVASPPARQPQAPPPPAPSASAAPVGLGAEEAAEIFDTGGFTRFSPDEVLGGREPSPVARTEKVAVPRVAEPEVEAPPETEPEPDRRPGRASSAPRLATRLELGGTLDAWVGRVLAFGLLLVIALTASVRSQRNTVFFPYPWQAEQRREFEGHQREALMTKVDRAIRTYYLLYGRFPEQLGILVDLELLAAADTSDPRGRVLEYSSDALAYTLQPSVSGVAIPGLERTDDVAEDFLLNPEYVAISRQDRRPLVLLD